MDKKIISDDEASIIAKSVAMSRLRSTADPAIDNETINALLNRKLTIKYNGVEQSMKDANGDTVYPISYNGTTYLPVRAICNMLGVDIEWDEQTNTVSISDVFLKLAEEYTSNRIRKYNSSRYIGISVWGQITHLTLLRKLFPQEWKPLIMWCHIRGIRSISIMEAFYQTLRKKYSAWMSGPWGMTAGILI